MLEGFCRAVAQVTHYANLPSQKAVAGSKAVHFFNPEALSVGSPMPKYPWLFDGAPDKPTIRGLALLTYIQWLGSWHETSPYYEDYIPVPIKTASKTE